MNLMHGEPKPNRRFFGPGEPLNEIESFEELRKLRLADEGYIVIKDIARPPITHRINAPCVSVDNFNEKVRINEGKTGRYFWVDSVESAARLFGAIRCEVCKPALGSH